MTRPKNVDDIYPLSPMQRLMLLHAFAADGNGVLFNQVDYEIRGSLDVEAYRRAWEDLVVRHPALRTAFLWESLPQPVQVVRTTVELPFRTIDLAHLPEEQREAAAQVLAREDRDSPITLGKAPLLRCTLVRLAQDHYRFFWSIHHLVVDRWSHAVLFEELRTLYAAHTRSETPRLAPAVPFRDYIAWLAQQDAVEAEKFWRDELAGLVQPTLLDPARTSRAGATRLTTRMPLSADATAALRARATEWRTTPGAMLLSAVGLLLSARTGRDDVVCGVTVSGRPPELAEAERAVGSFVNNVPARVAVRRERPLDAWVREVQRAEGRRQSFAHVSLADIQEWSGVPTGRALFDLLVLLNLTDEADVAWPGLEVVAQSATLDAGYPLVLAVGVVGEGFVLTLVHDPTFDQPVRLLEQLAGRLAELASANEEATVGDLVPAAGGQSSATTEQASHAQEVAVSPSLSRQAASNESESMPDALLRSWREVLGVEHVGLDDDFFALGGTSLQAAQLFARLERICGRVLPLSTLFTAGSVRALLAAIDRPEVRAGSLVRIRSSGTLPPIYAVPGIGGNVIGLSSLARHMGPDQPFCAFESPGLDGREAPLTSIESIAALYTDELLREPASDFHLLGICWGAAVAFEMARVLAARGRAPTSLVLMDPAALLRDSAALPAHADTSFIRNRLELYWDEFREGGWRDRSRMLASKARRAAQVLAGGEEKSRTLAEVNQVRVRQANTDAVTRYIPGRYEGRAQILLTTDRDTGAGEDPRLEWLTLIDPRPGTAAIEGGNSGDAMSPAHVGGFAHALRTWLDATRDDAS